MQFLCYRISQYLALISNSCNNSKQYTNRENSVVQYVYPEWGVTVDAVSADSE